MIVVDNIVMFMCMCMFVDIIINMSIPIRIVIGVGGREWEKRRCSFVCKHNYTKQLELKQRTNIGLSDGSNVEQNVA